MTLNALSGRVWACLDERLAHGSEAPICVGLSGGGDSVALLLLAADWARARQRRLLALTVDHRLNQQSAEWTRFAGEVARSIGADWQALEWQAASPGAGVTMRARLARHGLMAEAARASGARVILLGHTLDDMAESDWLRDQGSTLGRMRQWAPSPVWPQGRGVMLLRPVLMEKRHDLRDFLRDRGQDWIDDPANEDMTYGRSRARAALQGQGAEPFNAGQKAESDLVDRDRSNAWAGVLNLPRDLSAKSLAMAVVCAGGGDRLPRGEKLEGLKARLDRGEVFCATLSGARVEAGAQRLLIMREPGEFDRLGLDAVDLVPGQPQVWDGRFEITVQGSGWQVVPSKGLLAGLEKSDRARILTLPPAARASLPLLIKSYKNQIDKSELLGAIRPLVDQRLAFGMGEKTQEADLFDPLHSEMSVSALFSSKD